jgi:hypothetical protein
VQRVSEDSIKATGLILNDLHSIWQPHSGQAKVGKALFYDGAKYVFVRCGRKWGKTDLEDYVLHRWAMLNPNSSIYYVAPYYNQAAELIWHTGRLPDFLKQLKSKYIAKQYDTDKRLVFHNGSYIKLLGADNFAVAAGHTPDLIVYDEFADHDPRFDKVMRPNLAPKQAPILIVGSPSHQMDSYYYQVEDEFRDRKNGATFVMPTHVNHHISKEWLKEEEESYRRRNDYATFQREFLAMKVTGGQGAIFPMLKVPEVDYATGKYVGFSEHFVSNDILLEVKKYYKDYSFHCVFDAGTVTCFAVLLVAVHKYSRKVICLDEIYETEIGKMSSKQIFPRAVEKMNAICGISDRWNLTYDNAAAWFAAEVVDHYGVAMNKCEKDLNKKENKLNLIKDMLLEGFLVISNNCNKLLWEMTNYYRDEKGNIPKVNDHLIDCLRYCLNAEGYDTLPTDRWVDPRIEQGWRRNIRTEVDDSEKLNEDIVRAFYGLEHD